MSELPDLLGTEEIRARLLKIFPEGYPHRSYVTRQMAARSVFTFLYIGAVEGQDRWLAPKHIYRMTAKQAALVAPNRRIAYADAAERPKFSPAGKRWYADNTREPIRDETLRDGLVRASAVIVKKGVPTTSGKGRYALQRDFAKLFDPSLSGVRLDAAIDTWIAAHISKAALRRTALLQLSAGAAEGKVRVALPNGDVRQLGAGPSSVITKAVIEEFAPRFLRNPVVFWISESGTKVYDLDERLTKTLGMKIEIGKVLPDVILADVGVDPPLYVFVEVVATDGPVSDRRREELLRIARDAEIPEHEIAFVTAYADRSSSALRKNLQALAPGSFIWCLSESDILIWLKDKTSNGRTIADLLGR